MFIIFEIADNIKYKVNQSSENSDSPSHNTWKLAFIGLYHTLISPLSLFRIIVSLVSLFYLFVLRLEINGETSLYEWTILENHINLLPTFKERTLSYAQSHFWYVCICLCIYMLMYLYAYVSIFLCIYMLMHLFLTDVLYSYIYILISYLFNI
jgi:hypothetical protein